MRVFAALVGLGLGRALRVTAAPFLLTQAFSVFVTFGYFVLVYPFESSLYLAAHR
jgi:hypothetical protein